jgi:CHAT domain-containing protein
MYAGAARVIVSPGASAISDSRIDEHFYQLSAKQQAQTPAAALRAAQLTLWRQRRWNAPYYWAAFTLQGEYR